MDVSSHDRDGILEVCSVSLHAAVICGTEINKAGKSPYVNLTAAIPVVILEFVLAV